jgi:hypothetical protein
LALSENASHVVINLEDPKSHLIPKKIDPLICRIIEKSARIGIYSSKLITAIGGGFSFGAAPIVYLLDEQKAAVWLLAVGLTCTFLFCVARIMESILFPIKKGIWICSG